MSPAPTKWEEERVYRRLEEVRDLAIATKLAVEHLASSTRVSDDTIAGRVAVLEAGAKPIAWHQKGGAVALLLFLLTILVAILKYPTRDDLEKVATAQVQATYSTRETLSKLASEHAATVAKLDAAREAVAQLQSQVNALRSEAAAGRRR